MRPIRVGMGYDVHRLATGRRLVVGGVDIPFDKGLLGHSDADVLLHAISDALLGAAGLGDIGQCFPPNDPQYKDVSSLVLLQKVARMVEGAGYAICNIDSAVVAEQPKIMSHASVMKERIATRLGIQSGQVSIKATTSEGMGFVGRGEGIAAWAVALIQER